MQTETRNIQNTIESLTDALQIFLGNSAIQKKNEDNRVLMYRGQANQEFDLSPSIFRNGALNREVLMIRELKRLAPAEFINLGSSLDRLIKMQHYGLPTRLLDITSNPLVALFFACADESCQDKNGEVITFYDYFTPPDSSQVDLYAKLSMYEGTTHKDLQNFTSSQDSFLDQENKIKRDLLKLYFPNKYLFVSAPLNNERIRRQHGAFLLFGIDVDEQINPFQRESFNIKEQIIKDQEDGICRSFIVSQQAKKEILEALDVIGINRSFLFPEFEHQATYVKEKYLD